MGRQRGWAPRRPAGPGWAHYPGWEARQAEDPTELGVCTHSGSLPSLWELGLGRDISLTGLTQVLGGESPLSWVAGSPP